MWLRQWKVGTRLGAAFAVLTLLILLNGAIALRGLHQMQDQADALYHGHIVPMRDLKMVSDAYGLEVIDVVNKANAGLLSAPDAAERLSHARAEMQQHWQAYQAHPVSGREAELAREAQALFLQADAKIDAVVAALRQMNGSTRGALDRFDGPLYEVVDPVADKVAQLIDLQLDQAATQNEASDEVYATSQTLVLTTIGLALVLAVLAARALSRSVTGPMRDAIAIAHAIRDGDLTRRIERHGRDEASDMIDALAGMQVSLSGIVQEVRVGVESVTTASQQIAAGNQDLSARTESQSAGLQQTASSMDQLTGTVHQNASAVQEASQLADAAAGAAGRGGELAQQVVSAMGEIADASRRIADITGLIDGIAFQTNILALNAAVEAARAGPQGRGFAVVAGEVRALAQRAAEAAKEIKQLSNTAATCVDAGTHQARDAGASMSEIVEKVHRVAGLMGQISQAVTDQSEGIGQVNTAVAQMDHSMQQNAALVEENAAAAESLSQQARRLSQCVSGFRLDAALAAR